MKSMNKYLLLTSSAMIVARVASAALETDAKENKAVVNKLEFNRKYSELTPPTLVIPPFSSAKDYKRLAGICFLGVGDCGSGITFGKGDDYTKPCEPINPCTGFNLTNTASCTDGYTTCNTGCEDKFKCNPPQYTQTCEFPYQGVGTPKDGKYKSCECQAAFKYGTGDCRRPKFRIRRELPVTVSIPAVSVRQPIRNTVLRLMSASAIPVTANINPASVRLHIQETAKAKA